MDKFNDTDMLDEYSPDEMLFVLEGRLKGEYIEWCYVHVHKQDSDTVLLAAREYVLREDICVMVAETVDRIAQDAVEGKDGTVLLDKEKLKALLRMKQPLSFLTMECMRNTSCGKKEYQKILNKAILLPSERRN